MALLDNIGAAWRCEEASGSRADLSSNGETLTDNNTVTQMTGKIGLAAAFTAANSEFLSHTDDATLSAGAGIHLTLFGWFYFTGNTMGLAGKWPGGGQNEYLLYVQSDGTVRFYASTDGANSFNVGSRTPSTSAWHFIAGRYDGTNISVRVDAQAWENTAFTIDIFNGTGAFEIGRQAGVQYLDGGADEVVLFKRALTDAEVDFIYADGNGLPYPFTLPVYELWTPPTALLRPAFALATA